MPDGSLASLPEAAPPRHDYVPPEVEREAVASLERQWPTDALGGLRQLSEMYRLYAMLSETDGDMDLPISMRVGRRLWDLEDSMMTRAVETDADMLAVALACSDRFRECLDDSQTQDLDVAAYSALGRMIACLGHRVGVDLHEITEYEEPGETPDDHPHLATPGRMKVFRHASFGIDKSLTARVWLNEFCARGGRITFKIEERRGYNDFDMSDVSFKADVECEALERSLR